VLADPAQVDEEDRCQLRGHKHDAKGPSVLDDCSVTRVGNSTVRIVNAGGPFESRSNLHSRDISRAVLSNLYNLCKLCLANPTPVELEAKGTEVV